jgi:hypothetical protein
MKADQAPETLARFVHLAGLDKTPDFDRELRVVGEGRGKPSARRDNRFGRRAGRGSKVCGSHVTHRSITMRDSCCLQFNV